MADGLLQQGAMVAPPVDATETALTAATQSSILALFGMRGRYYTFVCDQAFNLNFSRSASAVTEPSTAYVFPAGAIVSFAINPEIKAFRAKATANGTLKWWISSYA